METIVVISVLSITLMLLFGSYSYILRKSRSKNTFDTSETVYKTYYVRSLIENYKKEHNRTGNSVEVYANDHLNQKGECTKQTYGSYYSFICDLSNDNYNGYLKQIKIAFEVDKFYYLNPKQIVNNAKEQATIDANYEKQQKDVIADDYKRLKQEIGEFRSHMQAMLQKQIDNLNDDEWQQALDEYFNTDRFYPDDGSEPIPVADDEDIEDDDDEVIEQDDVDKQALDDVNSYQDPSEGEEESKPMTGDSPNTEQIDVSKPVPKKRSGTTIVFPDYYKDK